MNTRLAHTHRYSRTDHTPEAILRAFHKNATTQLKLHPGEKTTTQFQIIGINLEIYLVNVN